MCSGGTQAMMSTFRLLQISVTANLGGLLAGIHLALFSGILENPSFAHAMSPGTGILSSLSKSVITTMLVVGFVAVAPLAGKMCDGLGRRPTLLVAASLFSISGVVTLLSTYFVNLGRFIAGAAYSIVNVVCPMYTAEIAPPATRGMLVNLYQLSITVGILLAQSCNLILADANWTDPITCAIVPALFMLTFVWLLVPESPIWLANRFATSSGMAENKSGNDVQKTATGTTRTDTAATAVKIPITSSTMASITPAKGSLGSGAPTTHNVIMSASASAAIDPKDIENQPVSTQSFSISTSTPASGDRRSDENKCKDDKTISLRSFLQDRSARRRLLIGSGLAAAQQCSGINAVIFFAPAIVNDVLQWSGTRASLQAAVLIGFANMVATIVSVILVDRYGRRTLLLAGGMPMIVCLIALGAMKAGVIRISAATGITSLVTYVVAFAITYGPLPFVVLSEIFPLRYKGMGMSICNGIQGVSSMFIGLSFLPLLEAIGGGVYLIYAGCMIAASVFVFRMVPETRKLSLQEIDELLEEKVGN